MAKHVVKQSLTRTFFVLALFITAPVATTQAVLFPQDPETAIEQLEQFREENKDVLGIDHKIDRLKSHFTSQLPGQAPVTCSRIKVPSDFAVPLPHREKKCDQFIHITKDDFTGKGKNGIIINRPGKYRLCSNISFKPTKPNVQAITITASDVVLDLGVSTLKQDLNKYQTGVYGVAVARDVHNVKITGSKNVAQIRDFTLAGIRVLGRTDQVTIENVTVAQTVPTLLTNEVLPVDCANLGCALITGGIYVGEGERSGFAFFGTHKNNHVTNLVMNRITVKGCMIASQVVMTFGTQIQNSSFVENTYAGLIIGDFLPIPADHHNTFEFPVGADITVKNCHFDRNVVLGTEPIVNPENLAQLFQISTAVAFNEVQNVVMENCTVNDNSYPFGSCQAAATDGARNLLFKNCSFNNNIGNAGICVGLLTGGIIPAFGGACVGIGEDQPLVQNKNVVVENCVALNNQAGTSGCAGIGLIFVDGGEISDSNASGNFTVNAAGVQASGIAIEGNIPGGQSAGITVQRCTCENNQNQGTAFAGTGFLVRSNVANVIYRDCVANNNGKSGENPAIIAAGFLINTAAIEPPPIFSTVTQNIVFDNVVANGNGLANPAQTSTLSAGITIRNPTNRQPALNVLIQKSTLTYNRKAVYVTNDLAGLVVKNNEADQNLLAGFDFTNVTSTKLVTGNLAYNNGPTPATTNFINVEAANVLQVGSNNLPDVVGAKNLSITPVP